MSKKTKKDGRRKRARHATEETIAHLRGAHELETERQRLQQIARTTFKAGLSPAFLRVAPEEFLDVLTTLAIETDRAAAIVGAEHLDALLRRLLDASLHDVADKFDYVDGPIGSFSARTFLARAMGLICREVANEMDLIRAVRNAFAHKLDATWSHPKVAKACDALRLLPTGFDAAPRRTRFTYSVSGLSGHLTELLAKPPRRRKARRPRHPDYAWRLGRPMRE